MIYKNIRVFILKFIIQKMVVLNLVICINTYVLMQEIIEWVPAT